MALTKITDKQLQDYVNALVPDEPEGGDLKKNREIRDTFLTLHESGQGADLSRGTLWGHSTASPNTRTIGRMGIPSPGWNQCGSAAENN